jgi:hypothetical protein
LNAYPAFSKPNIFSALSQEAVPSFTSLQNSAQPAKSFLMEAAKRRPTNTMDILGLENKTKKAIILYDICLPFYSLFILELSQQKTMLTLFSF